jgi:hypothetical protein
MKTTWKLLLLIIASQALLLAADSAQAFYNPNAGRWLSRDPVNEIGGNDQIAVLDERAPDAGHDLDPYLFAANAPVVVVDWLGLMATRTDGNKPVCACKCKSLEISYKPRLKNGKLTFHTYDAPSPPKKRYGFTIRLRWVIEGDGSKCTYGVHEPPGGVTGTNPAGTVDPSSGTEPYYWAFVRQRYDDTLGIPYVGKGTYTINVNLTQTYACWDAGLNPQTQEPSMTWGPYSYTGSSTVEK